MNMAPPGKATPQIMPHDGASGSSFFDTIPARQTTPQDATQAQVTANGDTTGVTVFNGKIAVLNPFASHFHSLVSRQITKSNVSRTDLND
jgi:hypothetical protein